MFFADAYIHVGNSTFLYECENGLNLFLTNPTLPDPTILPFFRGSPLNIHDIMNITFIIISMKHFVDGKLILFQWESEVMFFMIVIIAFRTRKSGSRTMLAYVSVASTYAKLCNVLLWFSADPVYGILYLVFAISKYSVFVYVSLFLYLFFISPQIPCLLLSWVGLGDSE